MKNVGNGEGESAKGSPQSGGRVRKRGGGVVLSKGAGAGGMQRGVGLQRGVRKAGWGPGKSAKGGEGESEKGEGESPQRGWESLKRRERESAMEEGGPRGKSPPRAGGRESAKREGIVCKGEGESAKGVVRKGGSPKIGGGGEVLKGESP